MLLFLLAHIKDVQHKKLFRSVNLFNIKIKVMKFHSAAANGIATEAFQNCNWGQIDPMVDRGQSMVICDVSSLL